MLYFWSIKPNNNIKTLISIVGPTAIGKTNAAIQIAQHFSTEIISCDSRQFYKEMAIGTAVPSKQELAKVKHHFIQHIGIEQNYTVGDFEQDAIQRIATLFAKHKLMLMVGGSGLYERAVNLGLDEFPEVPLQIRENLNQIYQTKGIEPLQIKLKELDAAYYKQVDLANPQRIIRALEVCLGSQKPYSSFRNQTKKKRDFKSVKIGLYLDRELIYDRINKRVDSMIEHGLIPEAQQLHPQKHLNALQTVGYKELFDYFDGSLTAEQAIAEIKKNTRRFAKRQLTWYRNDAAVTWFQPNQIDQMIQYIQSQTKS